MSAGPPIERARLSVFLGTGAPQSGTSCLHQNLLCHPALFLPKAKQTNFFDRHFDRGATWYAEQFQEAAGRTIGEITPSYGALHPRKIRLIREWLPDVRLLYMLRDPIDRAWSRARRRYARANGGSTEGLGLEELRAYEANQSIAPGDYAPGVMKGDHFRVLDHWLQEFDPQQLLVLRFEDLLGPARGVAPGGLQPSWRRYSFGLVPLPARSAHQCQPTGEHAQRVQAIPAATLPRRNRPAAKTLRVRDSRLGGLIEADSIGREYPGCIEEPVRDVCSFGFLGHLVPITMGGWSGRI